MIYICNWCNSYKVYIMSVKTLLKTLSATLTSIKAETVAQTKMSILREKLQFYGNQKLLSLH